MEREIKNITRIRVYRYFTVIVIAIFTIEFVIMILARRFLPAVSYFLESVIDSTLLVIVLYPVLYLFVIRPLMESNLRHRQFEKAIQESEHQYRILVETSPDCIKLFNTKGELLFLNHGGRKEHHLKNDEELRKWNFWECIIEEDRPKVRAAFKDALEGKITTLEIRHTYDFGYFGYKQNRRRQVYLEKRKGGACRAF